MSLILDKTKVYWYSCESDLPLYKWSLEISITCTEGNVECTFLHISYSDFEIQDLLTKPKFYICNICIKNIELSGYKGI